MYHVKSQILANNIYVYLYITVNISAISYQQFYLALVILPG